MAKIVFLCDHNYSGDDIRTKPLGGIASSTIQLAETFQKQGHTVEVHNARHSTDVCAGVKYSPLGAEKEIEADLIISNTSSRHFRFMKSGKIVAWQHNRTSVSRMWKRSEILPLFRYRPHLVALSYDAINCTPRYLPYRTRNVIPHAIDDVFLLPSEHPATPRPPRAFFASRASRNLDWVISCWKKFIHQNVPAAEFHIFTPPGGEFEADTNELKQYNIFNRGSVSKPELAKFLDSCQLLLYPGHINETGCQVALQAIGKGVPIITCGIGSLKDLVKPGLTGFVEKDMQAYAERVQQCFTDADLWQKLSQHSLQHELRRSYEQRAEDWINVFINK